MKLILFAFTLLLAVLDTASAATVDTVLTYSTSMKKNSKAVVITPVGYTKTKHYPVVYLLHGYSGNYADWITKVPAVTSYSDLYNLIIVCPDGDYNSWYFNSPVDSTKRYETYVAKELVGWIDEHYSTVAKASGRAITGLSMGGHGALYLSFRHQDVFGAAGSMSGGVDLRPFPASWDIAAKLGNYADHPEEWQNNSVINLTYLLKNNNLPLIIDCGTEDFFYPVNKKLHEKLLYNNIPHDFISRPGGHTWEYWTNAIGYQMLFMHNFFVKQQLSLQ
jgi:S-formylglutathione hydrolase FrmB